MQTKKKVDCRSNRWLAYALVLHSGETKVFAATADCEENYDIDDLWVSALTKSEKYWTAMPLENKTIKGLFQLKYDDEWNSYFSTANPKGIMRKLSGDTIPEDGYVYFVNSSKFEKLIERFACLAFLAPDGFILFGPYSLKKAFLGNVWYKNKSHTEEFGKHFNPHWEMKALLDLTKGTYYKVEGPREIFEK